MRSYLFIFLGVIAWCASAEELRWQLSAEQWARPRSGMALVEMAPLAEAVEHLDSGGPGARLLIGYPGGEEGSLWAFELRSWLIALGVPSHRIELISGSELSGALELKVEEQGIP